MTVSKPRNNILMILVFCLLQTFLVIGCGTKNSQKVFDGQALSVHPIESAATIILGNRVDWFTTDNIHIKHEDYSSVLLPAGTHDFEWVHVSV